MTLSETKTYIFTFCPGSKFSNCYIKLPGTFISARKKMNQLFGSAWAFQFPSEAAAGVKKWNLTEITEKDLMNVTDV